MKATLVPTKLVGAEDAPPIDIVDSIAPRSLVGMVVAIAAFGLRSFVDRRIRRRPPAEIAADARAFLESLGGMWVKAGQLFSLRSDILSREMVDELSLLQYRSFGFDPKVARQMVEAELGRPIASMFESFDDHPFAAASISQIHRARLRRNGAAVVVKVQRPGIAGILERDLRLIGWLLRQLKRVPSLSYMDWEGMIRELERMFEEEVDYRFEVSNLRRMRKILRHHKVVVPRVERRLCSRRVIVMEYLEGVVMSDYMRLLRTDPPRVAAWCEENGVVPEKVGSRLMKSFYRQILEDNLFHGDLHPGNILLLRDNRFALIDFGTIGNLDARFVKLYRQQAMYFASGDFSRAIDAYLLLADQLPAFDLDAYRTEFVEAARAWEARTHLDGLTFLERSLTGGLAMALSDINQRYRLNLSWQFLRVGRSISTMDANLSALLGTRNPNRILRSYFKGERRRAMRRLRRGGLAQVGSAVLELQDSYQYVSDTLRRQALPMQALPSRISQMVAAWTRAVFAVAGLTVLGVVATYALARERYTGTWLGEVHALFDAHPVEIAVGSGLALVLFLRLRAELLRIFLRPALRRPGGSRED